MTIDNPGAGAPPTGGQDPNSGAGSPPPTGGTPPPSGAGPQDWTTGLNDDARGYVQNKGFKDPGAVVESYRNLEKLHGVPPDRILKLPEKADDPAYGAIYERLGKPKDSKEYNIPGPLGKDGKAADADPKFAEWAKSTFHELNLTKTQAEKLTQKMYDHAVKTSTEAQTASAAEIAQQETALKKEWGAAYDQKILQASQTAKVLGLNAEALDKLEKAMGFSGVMKFVDNLGAKVGEGTFVRSGQAPSFNGALTPDQAKQKIASLRNDTDFVRRYQNGDSSARQEMDQLHIWMNPGT